jgi:hypothetical protein
MLKKFDTIHLALVATLVWDAQIHYRNKRRFKQLKEDNILLQEQLRLSDKQVEFLDRLLVENNVPVSEFDRIAFFNL